ncbi:hypothetical protein [Desulfoluna sp.]|uniref:hypothetical protein n=1 Tax=Desulfoluna sp. TaxID=2045199 RepID=UPI00261109B3|nr:hypothetical protein [Desulfoluna sp.]
MTDIQKTYTYTLKLYLATVEEPVFVNLREKEKDRFTSILSLFGEDGDSSGFFVSDTIDGKCIGVNIQLIQAVNILWEPTVTLDDLTHYDGPIRLLLKNRAEAIETDTETPDELHEFFTMIDLGPEVSGFFAGFTDLDGEELLINTDELVYIEAPSSLIDEGWEIITENDEIMSDELKSDGIDS